MMARQGTAFGVYRQHAGNMVASQLTPGARAVLRYHFTLCYYLHTTTELKT